MTTSSPDTRVRPSPAAGRRSSRNPFSRPSKRKSPNADLKWGIWAYFLLLIFEGALRKWILPGLATPLLVVRDPIAVWLVVAAYTRGLLPINGYIITAGLVGLVGTITAIVIGHGSIPVAIYGGRILLFHFPLLFVIGNVFAKEDVLKMGKVTLWIAIPMALLTALQFYSPQSAFVNRGIGGDLAGAGFSGALGYSRPPGTFSFTNGTTLFFGMVAAYVGYFWLSNEKMNRFLLIGATAALVLAIPISISRGLFFQVILSGMFAMAAISRKPEYLGRMIFGITGVAVALLVLSLTPAFQTASEVMGARFDAASRSEGGIENTLIDRFLGGLAGAILDAPNQPIFGYGIGMGTNVGSMFLSGGRMFLLAEGEWGRTVGELGPILGLIVVFSRLALTGSLSLSSYSRLVQGDLLSWMLLSSGFLILAQGNWAQPTALGFFAIIGGLILASLKRSKRKRKRNAFSVRKRRLYDSSSQREEISSNIG